MILPPDIFMQKQPDESEIQNLLKHSENYNDILLYEKESDFHNIKVVENEMCKLLLFNDLAQAGEFNHAEYTGTFPYLNYFLLTSLINPNIENVLMLGLGSGQLAQNITKVFKNLKSLDIVELDDEVVDIAKNFFSFKNDDKTTVYLQDARVFVRNSTKKYDLVIMDIGSNEGLVYRFLTQDFLKEANALLTDDGVLAANMFCQPDYKSEDNLMLLTNYKTYQSVFSETLLFKCDFSDELYYKIHTGNPERIFDISNLILFGLKNKKNILKENFVKLAKNQQNIFDEINLKNIYKYANDLYEESVNTNSWRILKDEYEFDEDFTLTNIKNFLRITT